MDPFKKKRSLCCLWSMNYRFPTPLTRWKWNSHPSQSDKWNPSAFHTYPDIQLCLRWTDDIYRTLSVCPSVLPMHSCPRNPVTLLDKTDTTGWFKGPRNQTEQRREALLFHCDTTTTWKSRYINDAINNWGKVFLVGRSTK